jgi:hypothetical protein
MTLTPLLVTSSSISLDFGRGASVTDWTIRRADIGDWAARYDGPKFHALLCDAPYHLGPGGFMGEGWDASGVSFRPETWEALAQHLYPGAFMFVFAGAINDDLISVAMRRAGLRRHYKVLTWVYGQGMPKGTRIDAQVYDEDTGQYQFCSAYGEARHREPSGLLRDRLPPTLLAGIWKGHRYGLQSLKPALEPVLVFQKPYGGKSMDDITRTGAGVLDIDGARIATWIQLPSASSHRLHKDCLRCLKVDTFPWSSV